MAEELEIKLTLGKGGIDAARAWLAGWGSGETTRKRLVNRYFDTPEQALNHERAALRVRQADAHYIQTLKTQGEFVDGAHKRQEWEWPLPGADLNLGLLADTPIAENVNLARLAVIFETNFDRETRLLTREGATIECALDSGTVVAGSRQRALAELELELKSGDSTALLELASQLVGQVPAFLNLVSKAEQGYYLAGLGEPASRVDSDEPVTAWLQALGIHWLTGEAGQVCREALDALHQVATRMGLEEEWRWALAQDDRATDWLFDTRLLRLQLGLLQRPAR
ncbi:CYTH domain-containing protein [Marinobacter halodurans]|uniref:CYTH domain-containing protein n=1 Tax=Marinobacter halodurans TaxID=2528979 RepID=A0ABY1ZM62_9GAMM|nr:CYTH domain-containing protein [Marinobacter halodurans]TBW55905.1 CYTH domain-containing protein [Marinobacter halodurans]